MYYTQHPYFLLYEAILGHDGKSVYSDVLAPWLSDNADEYSWLADFQARTNNNWSAATENDLWRLYALFRITSILLLRFPTPCGRGDKYPGPAITLEDFQWFHEQRCQASLLARCSSFHCVGVSVTRRLNTRRCTLSVGVNRSRVSASLSVRNLSRVRCV